MGSQDTRPRQQTAQLFTVNGNDNINALPASLQQQRQQQQRQQQEIDGTTSQELRQHSTSSPSPSQRQNHDSETQSSASHAQNQEQEQDPEQEKFQPDLSLLFTQSQSQNQPESVIPNQATNQQHQDTPPTPTDQEEESQETIPDSEEEGEGDNSQDLLVMPSALKTALSSISTSTSTANQQRLHNLKFTESLPRALSDALKAIASTTREESDRLLATQLATRPQTTTSFPTELGGFFHGRARRSGVTAAQRHPYIVDKIEHTLKCSRERACFIVNEYEEVIVRVFERDRKGFGSFIWREFGNESQSQSHQKQKERPEKATKKEKNKKNSANRRSKEESQEGLEDDIFSGIPLPEDNTDEDQDYSINGHNEISDDERDERYYGLEEADLGSDDNVADDHLSRRKKKVKIFRIHDDESQDLNDIPEDSDVDSEDPEEAEFKFRGHRIKMKNLARKAGLPQSFLSLQSKNQSQLLHSGGSNAAKKRSLVMDRKGVAKRKKVKNFTTATSTGNLNFADGFITEDNAIDVEYEQQRQHQERPEDDEPLPFNHYSADLLVNQGTDERFFEAIMSKYGEQPTSTASTIGYESEDFHDSSEEEQVERYQELSDENIDSETDFYVTDSQPFKFYPQYQPYTSYSDIISEEMKKASHQPRIEQFYDNEGIDNESNDENIYGPINDELMEREGIAEEANERIDYLLSRSRNSIPSASRIHNGSRSSLKRPQPRGPPTLRFALGLGSSRAPHHGTRQLRTTLRNKKSQVLKIHIPGMDTHSEATQLQYQPTIAESLRKQEQPKKNKLKNKRKGYLNLINTNMRLFNGGNNQRTVIAESESNQVVLVPIKSRSSIKAPLSSFAATPINSNQENSRVRFSDSPLYNYLLKGEPITPQKQEYILSLPPDARKILFSAKSQSFDENFTIFTDSLLNHHHTSLEHLMTHQRNWHQFQEFLAVTGFINTGNAGILTEKLHHFTTQIQRQMMMVVGKMGKATSRYVLGLVWSLAQVLVCLRIITKSQQQEQHQQVDSGTFIKEVIFLIMTSVLSQETNPLQWRWQRQWREMLEICFTLERQLTWDVIFSLNMKNLHIGNLNYIWREFRKGDDVKISLDFIRNLIRNLNESSIFEGFKFVEISFLSYNEINQPQEEKQFPEEVILLMYRKLAQLKFCPDFKIPDQTYTKLSIVTSLGTGLSSTTPVNIYLNCFLHSSIHSARIKESIRPSSKLSSTSQQSIIDRLNIYLCLDLLCGDVHDSQIGELLLSVNLNVVKSLECLISLIGVNEKYGRVLGLSREALESIIGKVTRLGKLHIWKNFLQFLDLEKLQLGTLEKFALSVLKFVNHLRFTDVNSELISCYIRRADTDRAKLMTLQEYQDSLLFAGGDNLKIYLDLTSTLIEAKLSTWDRTLQSITYSSKLTESQKLTIFTEICKDNASVFDQNKLPFISLLLKSLIFFSAEIKEALNLLYRHLKPHLHLHSHIHIDIHIQPSLVTEQSKWGIIYNIIIPYLTYELPPSHRAQIISQLITSLLVLVKSSNGKPEFTSSSSWHIKRILRKITYYTQLMFVQSMPMWEELCTLVGLDTRQERGITAAIDDDDDDDDDDYDLRCEDYAMSVMKLLTDVIGMSSEGQRSITISKFVDESKDALTMRLESLSMLMRCLIFVYRSGNNKAMVYVFHLISFFSLMIDQSTSFSGKDTFHVLQVVKSLIPLLEIRDQDIETLRLRILTVAYPVLIRLYWHLRGVVDYEVFWKITSFFTDVSSVLSSSSSSWSNTRTTPSQVTNNMKMMMMMKKKKKKQKLKTAGGEYAVFQHVLRNVESVLDSIRASFPGESENEDDINREKVKDMIEEFKWLVEQG